MTSMNMSNKVCVVTGANTGIGLETARGLAQRGARVVMTSRDEAKGKAAAEDVRRSTGNEQVELLHLDLADGNSIRSATAELLDRVERIDVLVNNAGVVLTERSVTKDGFETTFGVNHLGTFLFTHLLRDRIVESGKARIVTLASEAHRFCKGLDFDDLMFERRPYKGFGPVYGGSKLANILFTRELASRLADTDVVAHAVHPGVVRSKFGSDGDTAGWFSWGLKLMSPFLINTEQGARTSLHVATSDEAGASTGKYWAKSREKKPTRYATDDETAKRLWTVSEALWGLDTAPAVSTSKRGGKSAQQGADA